MLGASRSWAARHSPIAFAELLRETRSSNCQSLYVQPKSPPFGAPTRSAETYYGVPMRYVVCAVVVHAGQLWVRILDPTTQQCIREHAVTGKGQRRNLDIDRPKQSPPKIERVVER